MSAYRHFNALKITIFKLLSFVFLGPFLAGAYDPSIATINILCVEYSEVYRALIGSAFGSFNAQSPHQKIACSFISSKDQLESQALKMSNGMHLILCDPIDIGDFLSDLRTQAVKADFYLPPILAVTRQEEYYNPRYAHDRHFIGGRGKITTIHGVHGLLALYQELIGNDWREKVGRRVEWTFEDVEDEGGSCAVSNAIILSVAAPAPSAEESAVAGLRGDMSPSFLPIIPDAIDESAVTARSSAEGATWLQRLSKRFSKP